MNTENGLQEFSDKLMRWSVLLPKELRNALQIGGELVRREVQEKHLSGPKMPRGVGDDMNATLAVQTGTLRKSIALRIKVASGDVSAEIGTTVGYGRKHELGIGVPGRPFLRPSIVEKRSAVMQQVERSIMASYGK
jgi:phage gpG-like protein